MHRALVLLALLASACATTPGTRARMLRAPDGQLTVVETPRGHRSVELTLDRLAPPSAYDPQADSFVVWIVPREGVPVRAGEVRYDRRADRGEATVLTPYEDFRVLVTAEPAEPFAIAPGDDVIVDQDVRS